MSQAKTRVCGPGRQVKGRGTVSALKLGGHQQLETWQKEGLAQQQLQDRLDAIQGKRAAANGHAVRHGAAGEPAAAAAATAGPAAAAGFVAPQEPTASSNGGRASSSEGVQLPQTGPRRSRKRPDAVRAQQAKRPGRPNPPRSAGALAAVRRKSLAPAYPANRRSAHSSCFATPCRSCCGPCCCSDIESRTGQL